MECHSCGKEFSKVSAHWSLSSDCSHPEFSERQHELITGLLMGDGTIDDRNDDYRNPRLRVIMTNKKYLEYLRGEFPILSTRDPKIHATAEELSRRNHEKSFSNSSNPDDYSDQYSWQTISHPDLKEYASWYDSGEKIWPEDINLTPTVLKTWYVCDGSYNNNGGRNYLSLHLSNERKNKEKIEQYFEDIGVGISRWRDEKVKLNTYKTSISFTVEKTQELFDYMGDPVPGFNYKWP